MINELSYFNCFFPINVFTHCHFTKINWYILINGPRSQLSLRLPEQDNVKSGLFLDKLATL